MVRVMLSRAWQFFISSSCTGFFHTADFQQGNILRAAHVRPRKLAALVHEIEHPKKYHLDANLVFGGCEVFKRKR